MFKIFFPNKKTHTEDIKPKVCMPTFTRKDMEELLTIPHVLVDIRNELISYVKDQILLGKYRIDILSNNPMFEGIPYGVLDKHLIDQAKSTFPDFTVGASTDTSINVISLTIGVPH